MVYVCLYRGIYRLSRQSLNASIPVLISESIFARLVDLKFVDTLGEFTSLQHSKCNAQFFLKISASFSVLISAAAALLF